MKQQDRKTHIIPAESSLRLVNFGWLDWELENWLGVCTGNNLWFSNYGLSTSGVTLAPSSGGFWLIFYFLLFCNKTATKTCLNTVVKTDLQLKSTATLRCFDICWLDSTAANVSVWHDNKISQGVDAQWLMSRVWSRSHRLYTPAPATNKRI